MEEDNEEEDSNNLIQMTFSSNLHSNSDYEQETHDNDNDNNNRHNNDENNDTNDTNDTNENNNIGIYKKTKKKKNLYL